MQKDYMPDGWLGIILGSKIFIHLMKYTFEECMKRLFAEITNVTHKEELSTIRMSEAPSRAYQSASKMNNAAIKWTQSQVKDWLEKKVGNQKLIKMMSEFDGTLLRQICVVRKEAPEYFYAEMKNTYKLDFFEVLKFTSELDNEFKNS
jgi:hypothetical protein